MRLTLHRRWFSPLIDMRGSSPPISSGSQSPIGRGLWDSVASGLGYHLDNFGRWLFDNAPRFRGTYASLLAPNWPVPSPKPGWQFAEEYYDKRQWMACRRGALWEAAAGTDALVPLVLPWYGGTTVEVTLGNDNSLCLYVCGAFEPNEFAFLDGILQPGMTFVDVGANDGYYSLFAACRVGAGGRVVAIEPSTRERVNLKRNIARNNLKNVSVIAAALGAAPGEARLRLAHGFHSGHNTLGSFAHDDVVADSVEQVQVETLDSIVERLGLSRIDFIKIDVEGAEANVVRGGAGTLSRMRPILIVEVNDRALQAQGNSAESFLDLLRQGFDYEVLVFSNETGRVVRLTDTASLSANVVACPKQRVDELLGRT